MKTLTCFTELLIEQLLCRVALRELAEVDVDLGHFANKFKNDQREIVNQFNEIDSHFKENDLEIQRNLHRFTKELCIHMFAPTSLEHSCTLV